MKIVILGFGAVGQGVARVISLKREYLLDKYGLQLDIVAAADRSGAAVGEKGLDPELLLETKAKTGKLSMYPENGVEGVSGL